MSKLLHDKKILKGILKKKPNWRKRAVWAAVSALVFALFLAPGPVFARSGSNTVYFDDGKPFTANIWVQSIFDLSGCGKWQTSVVLPEGTRPLWIKNVTSFGEIGIGGLFGLHLTINGTQRNSIEWTNSNGADGSYLSGNVCANPFLTLHLGGNVTGTAFHYGNVRAVMARV